MRVPLEDLDADNVDLRTHTDETVVHMDGLGTPLYRTLQGRFPPERIGLQDVKEEEGTAALWSARVAGVEIV